MPHTLLSHTAAERVLPKDVCKLIGGYSASLGDDDNPSATTPWVPENYFYLVQRQPPLGPAPPSPGSDGDVVVEALYAWDAVLRRRDQRDSLAVHTNSSDNPTRLLQELHALASGQPSSWEEIGYCTSPTLTVTRCGVFVQQSKNTLRFLLLVHEEKRRQYNKCLLLIFDRWSHLVEYVVKQKQEVAFRQALQYLYI